MLKVTVMPLGPLDTNCYVVHSDREAVVIDPGGEAQEILSFLASEKVSLAAILNTHRILITSRATRTWSRPRDSRSWPAPRTDFSLKRSWAAAE